MGLKPPFKAKPEDVIFCPRSGREVSVDAYCHGWTFHDKLCHDADECEAYFEYAEKRLMELQAKRRKIPLTAELFKALEAQARTKD